MGLKNSEEQKYFIKDMELDVFIHFVGNDSSGNPMFAFKQGSKGAMSFNYEEARIFIESKYLKNIKIIKIQDCE